MLNNYESFDNSETSLRKSALIQERVGLVSTHMYKQFLDYQHATVNTNEIFYGMAENLQDVVETLKEAFASRNVTTQNIYLDLDPQKSVIIVNILWHKISFTTRCNFQPQALYRENGQHVFSGRIMAIRGNYYEIMKGVTEHDEEMVRLLDNEVASLFVPAETNQNSIMKIKHLANREFYLNQVDAPREFVLKVIETICGGGFYHEEGARKSFNI
ncbi:hypothetical protein DBY21_01515 [Candidatus Gastranaerophilales bacterium]|nr:MAG: hypothetical protein DBY21_01515 [Candidatus Gastranaerophilales bacterium]